MIFDQCAMLFGDPAIWRTRGEKMEKIATAK